MASNTPMDKRFSCTYQPACSYDVTRASTTNDVKTNGCASPNDAWQAHHTDAPEPQHYFVLSLLVAIFFNLPLGAVAIYLSCKAIKFFQNGDNRSGRHRAKAAFYISMLGMVTSSIIVMLSVFYVAYYSSETQ